ncbi:MAG: OmpH family outer membrane protein [Bacteroidia bacterium]|nr:OmpH family outer membrane protein [Bacteroidia bacterium]
MMKTRIILFAIAGLLVFIVVYLLIFVNSQNVSTKVAYIKNAELYNEFSLKKELENKLIKVKNQRKAILDSLYLPLKILSNELEVNGKNISSQSVLNFNKMKEVYLNKQKEFEEDNLRLTDEYSQQIWKQINQYVSDYGKEHGYSMIYGASGDGTLMYADEKYDITKDLILFVNEKYQGFK